MTESPMSDLTLNRLERDVEAARAKLALDLATLRSPATFAEFKDDVKEQALDAKDALVDQIKTSARSTVRQLVDDLAAKAAANPVAALAIGAGVAWRLVQRPPIASALVGAGLFSLLRTPTPNGSGPGFVAAAGEFADSATEKLHDWSTQAQDAAASLREKTEFLAQRAAGALNDAQQIQSDVAARTAAMASRASAAVQDTLADDEVRDKALLGAAALAVAAALGIAYQRRGEDHSQFG
jgi:ElaB/YqjD/DUF883 family membrane-anchored ribosome-binding protein